MALAIAHLLLAYTILVSPWFARYKYKQLQRRLAEGVPEARLRFYRLGVTQQWLRVGLILVFLWLSGLAPRMLGLTRPQSWELTLNLLITFFLAIVFSIFLFRYTGGPLLRRLLKMAGALIPTTPRERIWFAIISIGAGASEELLFRGLLLWYLNFFFPQLSLVQLIVISSAVFGYCHLYQGWTGMVGTGVVGALFAWLYLFTGSLVLPMVVHALVDLRILAVLTPRRLQSLQSQLGDQAKPLEGARP
jgi:CAAX protease family protein